jgi:predicted  nucleic acid-binding Zn-ribbon protein
MTIEIALLIAMLSIGFTAYNSLSGSARAARKDTRTEATRSTEVMVKLETISNSLIELKTEVRSSREEIQELRERIIVAEQNAGVVRSRLEELARGGAS